MDENVLTELEQELPKDATLYNPTVQPLSQTQKKGYFPVEKIPEGADVQWLNDPERQYDKKNWLGRFSTAFKNTWGDFINSAQRNNVTLGATKINWGKNKEEVEFGRQMAVEAMKNLERLEEGRDDLSPEQNETWAAGFGRGGASILEFAILTGAANAGLGPLAAHAVAGVVTASDTFSRATVEDVQKYIDETGDTELKNFGSRKDSVVNLANAAAQGIIEVGLNGVGRILFNNPVVKKVAGNTISKAERYFSSTALGRTLLTGADESLTNALEEGAQQISDNIASIVKDNKDFTWDNIMEGTGKSMIIGGVYGGAQAAALHDYGHRATRNYIEEKLISGAKELGIEVKADEIRAAADNLTDIIESHGIQTVADNTKKILDITDSESDLASTLAKTFQQLVDAGQVRFRNATPEEVAQAGLDWANYMQAAAIIDSMERGIPLTSHPLFNAVAEIDRIFLEGKTPTEGDLLGIDINNAEVQKLINTMQDLIDQSGQSRAAEEEARQIALREADLAAQEAQWRELERNARAALRLEETRKNRELMAQATERLAQIEERLAAIENNKQSLGVERMNASMIDARTARQIETQKFFADIKPKLPTQSNDSINFQYGANDMKVSRTNTGYTLKMTLDGKPTAAIEVDDNGLVKETFTDADMRNGGFAEDAVIAAENLFGPLTVTITKGNTAAEQFWKKMGYTNEIAPRTYTKATPAQQTTSGAQQMLFQEALDLAEEMQRLDEVYPAYTGDTINIDGVERTVYNSNGDRIAQSEPALRNFWGWFEDSKVVDEQGRPLVVYHGSTRNFDIFDINKASKESNLGAGFYFTNSKEDVSSNYEGGGPDFDNRVARLAEQISADEDIPYEEAKRKAYNQEFEDDVKYAVYLKMENPFTIGGENETFLTFEDKYNEETDTYEDPTGTLIEFAYQLDNRLADLGIDDYKISNALFEAALDNGGLTAHEIDKILAGDENLTNLLLDYADQSTGQLLSDVVGIEYDGFIDNTVNEKFGDNRKFGAGMQGLNDETTHYIAFESNQIKSTDNRGTFSPDTGNIYYQRAFAGSRTDYDTPSLEAIGTGEGNQAHGWGLYYAANPLIAEGYRKRFVSYESPISFNGKTYVFGKDSEYDTLQRLANGEPIENILQDYIEAEDGSLGFLNKAKATGDAAAEKMWAENLASERDIIDFIKTLSEDDVKNIRQGGQVHEVDIPEMDVLLDEQKTFRQQPNSVKKALRKLFADKGRNLNEVMSTGYVNGNPTGGQLYSEIMSIMEGSDKAASLLLRDYGIKGITYEGRQDGRAFVIFDARDVKVLRKKFDELGNALFQGKKTTKSTKGADKFRGAYDPLTRAIIFSKISDVSTLFHETAHYWFDRNLRYYRTGLASPEWTDHWEAVMQELGLTPSPSGRYSQAAIREASEKFARQQEAYLKDGHAANAAMQWAHQDYSQMVGRVYRNLWTQYYGLDVLTPAVKAWFDMNGYDVNNVAASIEATEADSMAAQENTIGNIVAADETQPSQDIPGTDMKMPGTDMVVENPYQGKYAIVPKDKFETGPKAKSKLPKSAKRATGVKTDDVTYNRRNMSESLEAASELVRTDESRAWDILKSPEDKVDDLYKGDVYRALINKYRAENNPVKIRQVVNAFAKSAREAGQAVKAFDLNDRPISYENAVDSIARAYRSKKADAAVKGLVTELKSAIHDKAALDAAWAKFKEDLGCK